MPRQFTRKAFLASVLGGLALSTGTTRARKKHRCHPLPQFTATEFCPAGDVYAENDGVCRPRSGECVGQLWYCKGHKHPQFLCDPVMFPERPWRCCRAGRDTPYVPSSGGGKGLCHGWKPKLVCPPPVV